MTTMTADDVRHQVLGGVPLRLILPRCLAAATIAQIDSSMAAGGPPAPGTTPWTIAAVVDTEAVARQAKAATHDPTVEPVPGVRLATRATSDMITYTVIGDDMEHRPGAWTLAMRGRRLLLTTATPENLPSYVLRIIREILIRHGENTGSTLFHAAGVTLDGRAVLIVGPPLAGKSTLLACVLHCAKGRAALMSNDRVLVHDRHARAVPLPVGLARGTLDAFTELRLLVPESDRIVLEDRFATRHKTTLTAAAFAAAFGSPLAPGGSIDLVLAPALTHDAQVTTVTNLDAEETARLLNEACYTPHDEFWRPWFAPREHTADALRQRSTQHCQTLARDVPAVRITHGVGGDHGNLLDAVTTAIGDLL
ncbi:MAG: hypothetical protein QG597_778 [Actinomycetota bacterium]|nr:hypothetical protein [Actinomycetota bacterium]